MESRSAVSLLHARTSATAACLDRGNFIVPPILSRPVAARSASSLSIARLRNRLRPGHRSFTIGTLISNGINRCFIYPARYSTRRTRAITIGNARYFTGKQLNTGVFTEGVLIEFLATRCATGQGKYRFRNRILITAVELIRLVRPTKLRHWPRVSTIRIYAQRGLCLQNIQPMSREYPIS